MRVLRPGISGNDVLQWQNFLRGQGFHVRVSGSYDSETYQSTLDFQRANLIQPFDGIVGDKTFGAAMQLGYSVVSDSGTAETSLNWPPKPSFGPLTSSERERLFGKLTYVSAPTASNPEAIRITNSWEIDNIGHAVIPQLSKIGVSQKVAFHKAAKWQLEQLWAAWESAGLIDLVKSWGGSYAPRFVRGSRTYLSNHAFGTAFDINVAWNGLGVRPALVGQYGSVRKLVPLANEWGFYWGGAFEGRPDGMHFEVAVLIPKPE